MKIHTHLQSVIKMPYLNLKSFIVAICVCLSIGCNWKKSTKIPVTINENFDPKKIDEDKFRELCRLDGVIAQWYLTQGAAAGVVNEGFEHNIGPSEVSKSEDIILQEQAYRISLLEKDRSNSDRYTSIIKKWRVFQIQSANLLRIYLGRDIVALDAEMSNLKLLEIQGVDLKEIEIRRKSIRTP